MNQRRVVIADHDQQATPRLSDTHRAEGETLFALNGLHVHWETIDRASTLGRPSGDQYHVVVIAGRITVPAAVGLGPLVPGDVLIAPAGIGVHAVDGPAEVLVTAVAIVPDAAQPTQPAATLADPGTRGSGVRRVILATNGDQVRVRQDSEPPRSVNHRPGIVATQVWQTGGPLRSADDGGDVTGRYVNVPPSGGVLVQAVQLDPAQYEPGDHDWHATPTVDIDVVVAGDLELALPDDRTLLRPGDIVLQYGTEHAWRPRGDEPVRLMAVMVDAPDRTAKVS